MSKSKEFNNSIDQACYQIEKTLIMLAACVSTTCVFYCILYLLGWSALGWVLFLPFVCLSPIGGYLYIEAVYYIGRTSWPMRLLLDAGVLLFPYVFYTVGKSIN